MRERLLLSQDNSNLKWKFDDDDGRGSGGLLEQATDRNQHFKSFDNSKE